MTLSIQEINRITTNPMATKGGRGGYKELSVTAQTQTFRICLIEGDDENNKDENTEGPYFPLPSLPSTPKLSVSRPSSLSTSRPPSITSHLPPAKLTSLLTASKPLLPVLSLSTLPNSVKNSSTFFPSTSPNDDVETQVSAEGEEEEESYCKEAASISLISSFESRSTVETVTEEEEEGEAEDRDEEEEEEESGGFEFSPPAIPKKPREPLFEDDPEELWDLSQTLESPALSSSSRKQRRRPSTLLAELFNLPVSSSSSPFRSFPHSAPKPFPRQRLPYPSTSPPKSLPSHIRSLIRPQLPPRSSSSPSILPDRPTCTPTLVPAPSPSASYIKRRQPSISHSVALDPLIRPEDEYLEWLTSHSPTRGGWGRSAPKGGKRTNCLPEALMIGFGGEERDVEREKEIPGIERVKSLMRKRSSLSRFISAQLSSLPNFNSTYTKPHFSSQPKSLTAKNKFSVLSLVESLNFGLTNVVEEFWRDVDGLNGVVMGFGSMGGLGAEEAMWRSIDRNGNRDEEETVGKEVEEVNQEEEGISDEELAFSLSTFSLSVSPLPSSPPSTSSPLSPTNPSRPVPPSRPSRRSRSPSSTSLSPPLYRPYRLLANSKHLLQLTLEMEMIRKGKIVAPLRGRHVVVKVNPPVEVWIKNREEGRKESKLGKEVWNAMDTGCETMMEKFIPVSEAEVVSTLSTGLTNGRKNRRKERDSVRERDRERERGKERSEAEERRGRSRCRASVRS